MSCAILIPAYNPDSRLVMLLKQLIVMGISRAIVVNDGSAEQCSDIFAEVEALPACVVLVHAVNQGKGRAIKTGINWILSKCPDVDGVVTADADGQHSPEDIMAVLHAMAPGRRALILGSRRFTGSIPLRSRFGNRITGLVFRLLVGVKVSDTQSGLRGIPHAFLAACIVMEGERYEYEINMLLTSVREGLSIVEIPIRTIYLEGNASSHFSPVLDSFRIYFVLLRFLLSSLTTSIIDYFIFVVALSMGSPLGIATAAARCFAGAYNFTINKKIVFKEKKRGAGSFVRYLILVTVMGTISFLGIASLSKLTRLPVAASKIIVETVLFIANFVLQRDVVFSRNKEND